MSLSSPSRTGRPENRTARPAATTVLAAAGLLYPVASVIGFAAFPEPPGGDVSAAHDPTWLAAHTGAVIAQSYVRGAAAVAFIALTVAVARTRPGSDPGSGRRHGALSATALAGGVSYAAFLLAAQASTLAAAFAARDGVAAATIPVLDSLDQALLGLSSLPAVLLFAAAGVRWRRTGVVPGWVAVLTLAGAPLAVLDALSYRGGPLAAVGLVGLLFFLLWSLIAAVMLLRANAGRP